MNELFQEAFISVNLVFTTLLILVVLYWIMVILGALDIDMFDIDFDADGDADFDTDMDSPGFLRAILEFFYVGEVPIMILVSILVLFLWFFSILGNYYLNPGRGILLGTGIAVGNFIVSVFIAKIFFMPVRVFFNSLNSDEDTIKKVVGKIGIVLTSQVSDKMGQIEIKTKGAPIVLYAKTEDGSILKKGDEALVTGQNDDKSICFVVPVEVDVSQ